MAFWVFDLDGTLITSGIDYARAVLRWGLMFIDTLEHRAPHYEVFTLKFIEALRDVDKERFKTMRAHRERFPGSMVEAYRAVCRHIGMEIDPEIERKTFEVGMSALSEETYRDRGMIPGAAETLQFLLDQGERIYCVTAGDPVVQWMKWRGYHLGRFFPSPREYRVVKWDKLPTLKLLRKIHRDRSAMMVGDSIGSDLVPAAKAGYQPIFVPSPSVWDHGELVNNAPQGTIKLQRIVEIQRRLKGMSNLLRVAL